MSLRGRYVRTYEHRLKMSSTKLGVVIEHQCRGGRLDPNVCARCKQSVKKERGRRCVLNCQCGRHNRQKGVAHPNFTGHHHSAEVKLKIAESVKRAWREGRKTLTCAVPNRAEQRLLAIIEPFGFRFVGNGALVIDGKCPDFWDGGTRLIELFGRHWHRPFEVEERIAFFKTRGYDCSVVWEDEIEEVTNVY